MNVELTRNARRDLLKLDSKTQSRIMVGVKALRNDPPTGDIVPIKGVQDSYRLRVGEYRVIYRVSDELREVLAILPRGAAYKKGMVK